MDEATKLRLIREQAKREMLDFLTGISSRNPASAESIERPTPEMQRLLRLRPSVLARLRALLVRLMSRLGGRQ
jgi:hypothetical protein